MTVSETTPSVTPVVTVAVTVAGGARETRACVYAAARPGRGARLVLAHGAGAGQTHPFLVRVAEALAARGVTVATFNFSYLERGRRAPDPGAVLEAEWADAAAALRGDGSEALFVGGKSMGGRIATQAAAARDLGARGIVLLGYPLHPPAQPSKLRVAHLPRVPVPMLFVQGTRDEFGTPEELAPYLPPRAHLHIVDGADHSFKRAKRLGDPLPSMLDAIVAWMTPLAR
jgi:uncharacterized protein